MGRKNSTQSQPRFNLSVQTLRVAHEALQLVPKSNAQAMAVCAQAMAEIEGVLSALPQAQPAEAPTEEAPAPVPMRKGKRK